MTTQSLEATHRQPFDNGRLGLVGELLHGRGLCGQPPLERANHLRGTRAFDHGLDELLVLVGHVRDVRRRNCRRLGLDRSGLVTRTWQLQLHWPAFRAGAAGKRQCKHAGGGDECPAHHAAFQRTRKACASLASRSFCVSLG